MLSNVMMISVAYSVNISFLKVFGAISDIINLLSEPFIESDDNGV
jgi:hypothetical protein